MRSVRWWRIRGGKDGLISLKVNAHHRTILNLNYTSITGVASRLTAFRIPCSVLRNRIATRKEEAAGWGQRILFRQVRGSIIIKKKNNRLYTGLSNEKDKRIFELDCLSDWLSVFSQVQLYKCKYLFHRLNIM